MKTMTGSGRQVVSFQTTAKASADAHALVNPAWTRLDVVIDGAALVAGLAFMASGQWLGILLVGGALIALASTRFHPLQRWLIARRFRRLLGKTTEVTIDDSGLGFANELGSSFVPWSSITVMRSNDQTTAFMRDRALLGYVPSTAFSSAEARAEFVEFATERLAVGTPDGAGPRQPAP